MSKIIVYEKSFQQNTLESYKNFCPVMGENMWRNASRTKKYGKFYSDGTKKIDDSEVKKHYSDKTKGLQIVSFNVVITEMGDKVTLKTTWVNRIRRVGSQFFSVRKHIRYVTYNHRTKNFYHGTIEKKLKKITNKKIRCNAFYLPILTEIRLSIRRNVHSILVGSSDDWKDLISFGTNTKPMADDVASETIKVFAQTLYKKTNILFNYESNYLEGELYKLYLEHNEVAYPDTVSQFSVIHTPKKDLRKYKNVVKWFMEYSNLKGRKVRTILNTTKDIDFITLTEVYHLMGVDYFNQINESYFTQNNSFVRYTYHSYQFNNYNFSSPFDFEVSNIDKKRIVKLINGNNKASWNLIKDHLSMINKLKSYGDDFKMKFTNMKEFDDEHYNLSELLESYRNGTITRIYEQEFIDEIETPIMGLNIDYYPVLLVTMRQYNEESQTQSNCVRTYIDKVKSIVISLRENHNEGKERATVEYIFSLKTIRRVQSRGRFNRDLTPEWDVPLEILDNRIEILFKNKKIVEPRIKKEFKNGKSVIIDGEYNTETEDIIDFFGYDDLPF